MDRRVAAFLLALGILPQSQLPAAGADETLRAWLEATTPTNTHIQRTIAREVARRSPSGYSDTIRSVPAATQPPALQRALDAYKRQTDANNTAVLAAQGNMGVLKFASAAGIALSAPTIGASLVLTGAGIIGSAALDKTVDILKEASRDAVRRQLKHDLDAYRRVATPGERRELTSTTDPRKFRALIEKRLGPVLEDALAGVPPNDRDIVNGFYNTILADTLKEGLGALKDVQAAQGEELARQKRQITAIGRTLAQFATKQQETLNRVVTNQGELASDLRTVADAVDRQGTQLQIVQDFMFAKMSPEEQLAALKGGLYPDMPPSERAALEGGLKLATKRKQLVDDLESYLNAGGQIVEIGRNLGLDGPTLASMQGVVSTGQTAFNAATAIASGNYLAAATAITGLFGGGGRDIEAERHEQTTKMFQEVFARFDRIEERLDRIAATQAQILENQAKLAQLIQDSHQQIMNKLDEIQGAVLYNRTLLREQFVEKNLAKCRRLIETEPGAAFIDPPRGVYPSPGVFRERDLNLHEQYYIPCTWEMAAARRRRGLFTQTLFGLESYRGDDQEGVARTLDRGHKPTLALLKRLSPSLDVYRRWVAALLVPVSTMEALDQKISLPQNPSAAHHLGASLEELLADPLAVPAVVDYAELASRIHYYYLLLGGDGRPLSDAQLAAAPVLRTTGLDHLKDARALLDVSVAQQALLAGDVLLPPAAELLERTELLARPGNDLDSLSVTDLRKLIGPIAVPGGSPAFPIFAENLVAIALRRDTQEKGCNGLSYAVAIASTGSDLLRDCTTLPWKFVRASELGPRKDVWAVELADARIPLPSAEAFERGELRTTNELLTLAEKRAVIAQELASYSAVEGMGAAQRREFNAIVLTAR